MKSNPGENAQEGPKAKCCLGVTYFNRTLESSGHVPKCMGLAQYKHGQQYDEDVRTLSDATGDFKYYCIGYSTHPTDAQPSRPGRPTNMPFCEGVEIAITEERVPAAVAPAGASGASSGELLRDQSPASLDQGSAAPLPPVSTGPSDEDRSLQSRFRKQLLRNSECLRSAVLGEKLPELPVQLRTYDSVDEATKTFVDTASINVIKMRMMAEFITHRTMSAVKPFWERFGSEEETE